MEGNQVRFGIFTLGYALVVAAAGVAAVSLGLPAHWVLVVILALSGLGLIGALQRTDRSRVRR